MTDFTPVSAILGGALLGVAAVLLMRFNGRIAGISGMVNGLFSGKTSDKLWRLLFVLGLALGGLTYQKVSHQPLITREEFPLIQLVLAGWLVGVGTKLGSGCTSGHGVCGVARLSPRSIVSTIVFLSTGAVVATGMFLFFSS